MMYTYISPHIIYISQQVDVIFQNPYKGELESERIGTLYRVLCTSFGYDDLVYLRPFRALPHTALIFGS